VNAVRDAKPEDFLLVGAGLRSVHIGGALPLIAEMVTIWLQRRRHAVKGVGT
jgi:hypothetical protein